MHPLVCLPPPLSSEQATQHECSPSAAARSHAPWPHFLKGAARTLAGRGCGLASGGGGNCPLRQPIQASGSAAAVAAAGTSEVAATALADAAVAAASAARAARLCLRISVGSFAFSNGVSGHAACLPPLFFTARFEPRASALPLVAPRAMCERGVEAQAREVAIGACENTRGRIILSPTALSPNGYGVCVCVCLCVCV